jgi:curved DNA-binding protein CbpA
LGVEPTASAAEIKRVYRNLSREYHPDRLGNKAVVEGKCYGSVSWEETMVKCGSSRTNEEEKHYCSEDCREFWTTSEERFKEIARAYGVLSDEVKRRDYDNGGVGRDIGDINDFRAEIIADIERIIVEKKLTAKELSACNMPLN